MKRIIFILFFSLVMISSVVAIDTSGWKVENIGGHEFKIPPKYENGELKKTSYEIENWNNFAILCVDTFLSSNYGYVASNYKGEDLTINGHPARYFCGYNSYEKTNLSRVYYAVGDSIYCVSWKSDNLSDDVREIVATSEPSELSSSKFYSMLDSALSEYKMQEAIDNSMPDPQVRVMEKKSTRYIPLYYHY